MRRYPVTTSVHTILKISNDRQVFVLNNYRRHPSRVWTTKPRTHWYLREKSVSITMTCLGTWGCRTKEMILYLIRLSTEFINNLLNYIMYVLSTLLSSSCIRSVIMVMCCHTRFTILRKSTSMFIVKTMVICTNYLNLILHLLITHHYCF